MNYLKCKRCDHEWLPRTNKVMKCPRCGSYLWKTARDKTKTDKGED